VAETVHSGSPKHQPMQRDASAAVHEINNLAKKGRGMSPAAAAIAVNVRLLDGYPQVAVARLDSASATRQKRWRCRPVHAQRDRESERGGIEERGREQ